MGRAGAVVGGGSAFASSEMANEDVADELASHGVHGVERGERAALLVPPERGVGLELGRLPGVHGIDPGVALALARASVGEVARCRDRASSWLWNPTGRETPKTPRGGRTCRVDRKRGEDEKRG